MRLRLYPVAVLKPKFAVASVKIIYLGMVAFELAARLNGNDVVIFDDVLLALAILKSECGFIHIKVVYLLLVD